MARLGLRERDATAIVTAPPPAAPVMSGDFLVMSGEEQACGEDQAEVWLGQTGWRKLERRPLAGPTSVIIAEAV